ncbi:MAG: ABC transporter permease [Clostridiales bacterium]|nr:ABC transporter permease [Clostridiales bacterium]
MKSQASYVTLAVCIGFVIVVFAFFTSIVRYYAGREPEPKLRQNIVVVNSPDSFNAFLKAEGKDIRSRLVKKKLDAYFDVFTFNEWMEENDAFMVIVFPEDFDKKCLREQVTRKPEILTYCDEDKLDYVRMKEEFVNTYISERYFEYLQREMGVPLPRFDVPEQLLDGEGNSNWYKEAKGRFARMVVPLLFFICVMYVCMLSGMNAIAGEKERGTFASILMTPASRGQIVLGNYLGVALHAIIPCAVLLLPIIIINHDLGVIGVLFLAVSLTLLMAAITILISCMSNSIVSAQTAFLPIFLIVLVVCVTCMQTDSPDPVNLYVPIYGHFYGFGDCLMSTAKFLPILVCILSSLILTAICLLVSKKLLETEAFTVAVESKSDKEIRKAAARAKKEQNDYVSSARANVFGYRPTRRSPVSRFLVRHAVLPLALLSVFQTLAMIPAIISFMKTPESISFFRLFRDLSGIDRVTDAMTASAELFNEFMQNRYFILFMGIGYWCIIGAYMLIVRLWDRQPLSTLGFPASGSPLKSYFRGLLFGLLMIFSVYGLLLATGQAICNGWGLSSDAVVLFILYILMWIPQGATEEIMMRGYMMPRVAGRFGVPFAVIFSSMCFSLMHAGNAGYSLLAMFNLAFIAVFFACVALRDGHIYTVCAMHTVWNFCQGNVFGLEVSGNTGSASILSSSYTSSARDLFTGGAFGPEGGLCVTIVIALSFVILLLFGRKKKENAGNV